MSERSKLTRLSRVPRERGRRFESGYLHLIYIPNTTLYKFGWNRNYLRTTYVLKQNIYKNNLYLKTYNNLIINISHISNNEHQNM